MVYLQGLLPLVILCDTVFSKQEFTTVYKWKQLEFDYPSALEREQAIQNGNFDPAKLVPIDVDVYYARHFVDNKMFITIPRNKPATPASLGTISGKKINENPVITPYPNWDWHLNPESCNKNRIVSVFRVMVDECSRLWVLDTGVLGTRMVCPPQLLVFDLKSDTLINKYEFPSNQYDLRSMMVTPIVEVLDRTRFCRNTFVYIADCQAFALIVYDFNANKSWRIIDKTMFPYPTYGTYTILDDRFELMDGILGMSLSPISDGIERKLFYHAASSPTENWVYTAHLRNESLFSVDQPKLFHTLNGQRKTQSFAEAIDSNGILYYGLVEDIKIACFNTKSGYYGNDGWATDIVADNPVRFQFPSGMKISKNKRQEDELWILTSRFQKLLTGSLKTDEVNFRILAVKIDNLIPGTRCQPTNKTNEDDVYNVFIHIYNSNQNV
ncbi:major royal jelly protein 3-like isoform X2 [Diabrotica virgifera virgifera]|uniref:Protein yellow-like n=1 Tax=Diabrotica virgifera virgifera TaxID=50390 RepID=A0ABM5KN92_DIAVI|nr:major royal jelly protein 3-like isoform X2 [Diabrotica virgifera virgifera]